MAYTVERVREIINLPAQKLRWRNVWADGAWVEVLMMNGKLLPLHSLVFILMCAACLYVQFSSYIEEHISPTHEDFMAHVLPDDAAAIAAAEQELYSFDEAGFPGSDTNERYRNQLVLNLNLARHRGYHAVRPVVMQEAHTRMHRRTFGTLFVVGFGYVVIVQLSFWLWFATRPQQALTYLRRLRARLERETGTNIIYYDAEILRLEEKKSDCSKAIDDFKKHLAWLRKPHDHELPGMRKRADKAVALVKQQLSRKREELLTLETRIREVSEMKKEIIEEVAAAIRQYVQIAERREHDEAVVEFKKETAAKLVDIERSLGIEPVGGDVFEGILEVCDVADEGNLALVEETKSENLNA